MSEWEKKYDEWFKLNHPYGCDNENYVYDAFEAAWDIQQKTIEWLRADIESYEEIKLWQKAKLDEAIELLKLVQTKGCYCHVGADDGYRGTRHTETCSKAREFLDKHGVK